MKITQIFHEFDWSDSVKLLINHLGENETKSLNNRLVEFMDYLEETLTLSKKSMISQT